MHRWATSCAGRPGTPAPYTHKHTYRDLLCHLITQSACRPAWDNFTGAQTQIHKDTQTGTHAYIQLQIQYMYSNVWIFIICKFSVYTTPHVIMYTCNRSFDHSFLYHHCYFMFLKLFFFFNFPSENTKQSERSHSHFTTWGSGQHFFEKSISEHTHVHTYSTSKKVARNTS